MTVRGVVDFPDVPTQRRLAARLADCQPDPGLLSVGSGATVALLTPTDVAWLEIGGVTSIAPSDLLTTGPDPFSEIEGLWIRHLNDRRCPVVDRLADRMGRHRFDSRPLVTAIDRYGLTFRATFHGGSHGALRLPFAADCASVADLGREIRLLMGCPRSARPLRARGTGDTDAAVDARRSRRGNGV